MKRKVLKLKLPKAPVRAARGSRICLQALAGTVLAMHCVSSPPAFAEESATKGALHRLEEGVRKVVLSNGLRVLMFRRPNAPVFAGQTWVKVGGVNEVLGKTGAAHLLEHMAFKGTEQVGTRDYSVEKPLLDELEGYIDRLEQLKKPGSPGAETPAAQESNLKDLKKKMEATYQKLQKLWVDNEFSITYERQGATGLNAATAKDYTMYRVNLPKVAFELWCWMESERLLHPVFRQFYKERDVVHEERRMRTDDDPSGRLYEAFISTSFWSHPYGYPTVGWPNDINTLRKKDTEQLYQAYYRPDNMVLAIVGDLDPDKSIPILEKYIGKIPAKKEPIPELRAVEVPQRGAREVTLEFDAEPNLLLGYHKPAYPDPDDLKFTVLHAVLSGGRSSLLFRELVLKEQLATSVATTEAPGQLYPSMFVVDATPRAGVTNEKLADALQKIFDRLQTQGFTEQELQAAKRRVRVGFLRGLGSNEDVAETIGESEALYGDWKAHLKMFEMVEQTTSDDLKRLARQYLRPSNRTYAHLERPKS